MSSCFHSLSVDRQDEGRNEREIGKLQELVVLKQN